MKRLAVLLIGLLLVPAILAQNDTRDFQGYRWYDDGIRLIYPLSVAGDAVSVFVPATANTPEETQIVFQNYDANLGWLASGAEVHIMPVSEIPADRIDLLAIPDSESDGAAHFAPLDFQTGSGIRFISIVPDDTGITKLLYQFAGRTADGFYAIKAEFPVGVSAENPDIQTLIALPETDFSPNLSTLDSLINSIRVISPLASFVTSQVNGRVDYDGIQFVYDSNLAYRIEVDSIAPIIGSEAENTMFGVTPGFTRFSFVGFPVTGNIQSPLIMVMPVEDFPGIDQPYGARLHQLQSLLAERPQLSPLAAPGAQNPLPILPLINAAQSIVSQPQYIRFANGEGLRYITYYSQSSEPVTATDLFYTFAGITDDGQHVVMANFPLFAGFLPQGRTVYQIADLERFALNYQTYLDGLLLQIDVMDGSAYSPQIRTLDALIGSISIS